MYYVCYGGNRVFYTASVFSILHHVDCVQDTVSDVPILKSSLAIIIYQVM